jgi:hypothetical protein
MDGRLPLPLFFLRAGKSCFFHYTRETPSSTRALTHAPHTSTSPDCLFLVHSQGRGVVPGGCLGSKKKKKNKGSLKRSTPRFLRGRAHSEEATVSGRRSVLVHAALVGVRVVVAEVLFECVCGDEGGWVVVRGGVCVATRVPLGRSPASCLSPSSPHAHTRAHSPTHLQRVLLLLVGLLVRLGGGDLLNLGVRACGGERERKKKVRASERLRVGRRRGRDSNTSAGGTRPDGRQAASTVTPPSQRRHCPGTLDYRAARADVGAAGVRGQAGGEGRGSAREAPAPLGWERGWRWAGGPPSRRTLPHRAPTRPRPQGGGSGRPPAARWQRSRVGKARASPRRATSTDTQRREFLFRPAREGACVASSTAGRPLHTRTLRPHHGRQGGVRPSCTRTHANSPCPRRPRTRRRCRPRTSPWPPRWPSRRRTCPAGRRGRRPRRRGGPGARRARGRRGGRRRGWSAWWKVLVVFRTGKLWSFFLLCAH